MNDRLHNARRLSVAPMMDWTDRHCRYFHRILAPGALLYTEMVTTGAVLHGDRTRLLGYSPEEHPLALQLGGSDPAELAAAARIGADLGFDEINLNVGCPSDRVQSGRFGACLMKEPELVAEGVAAMIAAVPAALPVTVKCRLGVDDQDDYEALRGFVDQVAAAGCAVFIVHARKAWLSGLSPRENREVPPLHYAHVYRLKRERPDLCVVINGGIVELAALDLHLGHCDGVMVGRAAYHEPWTLHRMAQRVLGDESAPLRREDAIRAMRDYVEEHLAGGDSLKHISRHWLGLFHGEPGARGFRRTLSEGAHRPGADWALVERALACVSAPARAVA
jgi:tRNA-dihydrouridine synthase A